MLGGIKGEYDCITAFSETDFTQDLNKIDIPVLVLHGDADQIVPLADSAPLTSPVSDGDTTNRVSPDPERRGFCLG